MAVSGADPLNLAGILTPGAKLAAIANNRVLFRGGIPVAIMTQGEIQFLETLNMTDAQRARDVLLKRPAYVASLDADAQPLDESDLSGAAGVS